MPRIQKRLDFPHGVQRALSGSIRVLLRLQVGLEDRLQDHQCRHLHHPIANRWNPQRPLLAVRLRDINPTHGLRPIRSLTEFFRQFVHPSLPAIRLDGVERLAVHPSRSSVLEAAAVGKPNYVLTIHLVVKSIEAIRGRTLRFGMQRLLELPNLW